MRAEFSSNQLPALPEQADEREPSSEVSVYHFTSELFGGAGVAAQRLHSALAQCNVRSRLFYGAGNPPEKNGSPVYRNQTFFWRNVAALAVSRRHRRNIPGGLFTSALDSENADSGAGRVAAGRESALGFALAGFAKLSSFPACRVAGDLVVARYESVYGRLSSRGRLRSFHEALQSLPAAEITRRARRCVPILSN